MSVLPDARPGAAGDPPGPASLWIDWREAAARAAARGTADEAAPRPAPALSGDARTRHRALRRPAPRRPVVVDGLGALAGMGLGVTLALGVTAESAGSLQAAGGIATALGRLTGLAAAYAMVVVVLLVARVGPLERAIGQDRLVAWHRRLGPWPLGLLCAHGALITVGYAQAAHDGLLHQFGQLLWTYPGILAATAAFVLLMAAGVTSYRLARRRLAHETWWAVHLYTYLALFLAFSHQVDTGASFVGHTTTRSWWTALWIVTLATVVTFRVLLPLWRSLRHRVRVLAVEPAGPGTVSVVLGGHRLDRLPAAGGQFFQWRLLQRGLWWQAHPYSLSEAPTGDRLRITVKDLGDHSGGLAALRPGTRVAIEGPYGAFTADARSGDEVLLVGAGAGAAPVLALLQDLPDEARATVLLRASSPGELVLREAIAEEAGRRGARVVELVGPRERVRLDAAALAALVPGLTGHDVFLCGPDGFTRALREALRAAGVPSSRVHFESFAL